MSAWVDYPRSARSCGVFLVLGLVSYAASAQERAVQPAARELTLSELVDIGLAQNPALNQVLLGIDAARGQAVQARLYPNPVLSVAGDEMGGRNGQQGGIVTAPLISQEIITAGKRRLDIAIARRRLDQATIAVLKQRYALMTAVRQGFFEVLEARQRVTTLLDLEKIAKQSHDVTQARVKKEQAAELELLQIQVEFNRVQAELRAGQREQTAAWRRLAALISAPDLAELPLAGKLGPVLPEYDYESSRSFLLDNHPEVSLARVGISEAELVLRRNQVQAIPNVEVGAGYVRQNQDKQDLWTFQVGVPIPVFSRNQGNVQSARAELGKAAYEVTRVQNDLTSRLATAHGAYAAAKERVQLYRKTIVPTAEKANQIAVDAYKAGGFDYLRVLQSQRVLTETRLDYLRALGSAWRAASELSGLLLEEEMAFGLAAPLSKSKE